MRDASKRRDGPKVDAVKGDWLMALAKTTHVFASLDSEERARKISVAELTAPNAGATS
jgi:hypothetical protein